MSSFLTMISDPTTDDPIKVEVFYERCDIGTDAPRLGFRMEVVDERGDSPRDLWDELEWDVKRRLKEEALSHWEREMELDRFGDV